MVLEKLKVKSKQEPKLDKWKKFLTRLKSPKSTVNIAVIGKYVELQDAYKSIYESFIHAGAANECKVKVTSLHSKNITQENVAELLEQYDAILVAPGFGERAIQGKIEAIRYAREHGVPFLGICLGMQMSVIEYSRNVLGWEDAHSAEMTKKTTHPVINIMDSQKEVKKMGGTMRLGAYPCRLEKQSLAYKLYKSTDISERHRHRYEFNNQYRQELEQAGLYCSGINVENNLVEIVELKDHPFFIGVQFHPELKSTPENPHPLFIGLVNAAIKRAEK